MTVLYGEGKYQNFYFKEFIDRNSADCGMGRLLFSSDIK